MGSNEMSLLNGYVARFTIVQGRTYSKKKTVTFEEAKSFPRRRLTNFVISNWTGTTLNRKRQTDSLR